MSKWADGWLGVTVGLGGRGSGSLFVVASAVVVAVVVVLCHSANRSSGTRLITTPSRAPSCHVSRSHFPFSILHGEQRTASRGTFI